MARSNYSAGKRQREQDKARKKREKSERRAARDESGGVETAFATVDEVQGGLMSIAEVVAAVHEKPAVEVTHNIPVRLFVGGLSWGTGSDLLRVKFEEYGPVDDAAVVTDRDTGRSRGFGFVTMASRKDAAKVIRELDGAEFEGRTLVVRQATERPR